jgi:cell division septation protein DedD
MLKFVFWSLLAANAVLLAYSQGVLGNFKGNEREPARMKSQLNTDKLVLVPAARASAAAPEPARPPAEPAACLEVGDFAAAEARRFEARLAPLGLGERLTRQVLGAADTSSYMVYIPPQGGKEAADRKAAELKTLGVTNYFILSDGSPLKWGISLGVFKSEAAAQTLLAALNKQGVHSARIAARGGQAGKVAFQLRDVDAPTKTKIDDIAGSFPAVETRGCK